MLLAGIASPVTGTNCYVIAPGAGEQCVIVDPGVGVGDALDEIIAEKRLRPIAVLLTHGHFDHTFSVLPVCQARDVPAYVHPADRGQLTDPWSGVGLPPGAPILDRTAVTWAEPDDVRELVDAEPIALGGLKFSVRHAPGHSLGSVVFGLVGDDEQTVLSGDVLFAGSIGRVDLPGGSMEQMNASLREVILPLPDETVVQPGHGPSTTVGRERAGNPFLRALL